MPYFVKNKTKKAVKSRNSRFSTSVTVAGGGTQKRFQTSKPASKYYNQSVIVDNVDTGVTLFKTTPVTGSATDGLGSEMYDFQELVLHNSSPQTAEIMIQVQDWGHGTDDTKDGTQTELKMLLKPRQTFVLPTSHLIQYSAANSASNSHIRYFWDGVTPNEDGDHEYPGQVDPLDGKTDGSALNGASVDVVNSSATAKTDELGNYNYSRTNIHSDLTATFFGVALDGFVPGSFSIRLCEHPFQTVNISKNYRRRALTGDDSGLTAGARYYVKFAVDGGSAVEVNFYVDSTNTHWGGPNGVIGKINAALKTAYELSSHGLFKKLIVCKLVDGDLRFTSFHSALHHNNGGAQSQIAITAGTTSTNLLVSGYFTTDITTVAPRFSPWDRPDNILWDDGHGNLNRRNGGTGTVNYSTGMVQLTGLPSFTEMSVVAISDSALGNESTTLGAGQGTAVDNIVVHVKGRSTNLYRNSKIDVFVAGN